MGFIHEYMVDNWEREMEGANLVGWIVKVTFPTGRRGKRVWHQGFIMRFEGCVFKLSTRVFTVNTPPPGGNPLPVGDGNWTG